MHASASRGAIISSTPRAIVSIAIVSIAIVSIAIASMAIEGIVWPRLLLAHALEGVGLAAGLVHHETHTAECAAAEQPAHLHMYTYCGG